MGTRGLRTHWSQGKSEFRQCVHPRDSLQVAVQNKHRRWWASERITGFLGNGYQSIPCDPTHLFAGKGTLSCAAGSFPFSQVFKCMRRFPFVTANAQDASFTAVSAMSG
jgi:hypothetical protein